jgi:hypothetical protein
MNFLEFEIEQLQNTGDWRSEKSSDHLNDDRNADAAETLRMIVQELRSGVEAEPEFERFSAICTFVFEEASADESEGLVVIERWNEYRSRIGFDHHPSSAKEYLGDLIKIALDAAPALDYLKPPA